MDFKPIESLIKTNLEKYQVPSLSLAVVKGEDVIYSRCFGYRDMEKKLPPDNHTRYAIASITKSMTATCLGILKDEGKLDWDTPIINYIPEFRMFDNYTTYNATLRDMLTHMTGLPSHDNVWYSNKKVQKTKKELVESIAFLKPSKGFRTTFQYNNLMYTTASYIIERLSGKTWNEFICERLFEPLGMTESSTVIAGLVCADNRALPYKSVGENITGLTNYLNFDSLAGAGSVNSTIEDMTKYLSLYIGKGIYKGKRIVSERTLSEIYGAQTIKLDIPSQEMPVTCYGYGWNVQPYRGHLCIQHAGGIDGFASYVTFLPFEKVGIVLLSNHYSNFLPSTTAYHIYDKILGLSPIDWESRHDEDRKKSLKELSSRNEKILVFRDPKKEPTVSLRDYTGNYIHPGYGKLNIRLEQNMLFLLYNDFEYQLDHSNFNTFDVNLSHDHMDEHVTASFKLDSIGNVSSIIVDFEPCVIEPIEFTKVSFE